MPRPLLYVQCVQPEAMGRKKLLVAALPVLRESINPREVKAAVIHVLVAAGLLMEPPNATNVKLENTQMAPMPV